MFQYSGNPQRNRKGLWAKQHLNSGIHAKLPNLFSSESQVCDWSCDGLVNCPGRTPPSSDITGRTLAFCDLKQEEADTEDGWKNRWINGRMVVIWFTILYYFCAKMIRKIFTVWIFLAWMRKTFFLINLKWSLHFSNINPTINNWLFDRL